MSLPSFARSRSIKIRSVELELPAFPPSLPGLRSELLFASLLFLTQTLTGSLASLSCQNPPRRWLQICSSRLRGSFASSLPPLVRSAASPLSLPSLTLPPLFSIYLDSLSWWDLGSRRQWNELPWFARSFKLSFFFHSFARSLDSKQSRSPPFPTPPSHRPTQESETTSSLLGRCTKILSFSRTTRIESLVSFTSSRSSSSKARFQPRGSS